MPTIDPHLNPQLTGLEALDRQRVDGLQGRQGPQDGAAVADPGLAELVHDEAPRGPAVDEGETVLNAPAWDDAAGPHLLQAEGLPAGFTGGDLAQDAQAGVDNVAAVLGFSAPG